MDTLLHISLRIKFWYNVISLAITSQRLQIARNTYSVWDSNIGHLTPWKKIPSPDLWLGLLYKSSCYYLDNICFHIKVSCCYDRIYIDISISVIVVSLRTCEFNHSHSASPRGVVGFTGTRWHHNNPNHGFNSVNKCSSYRLIGTITNKPLH